MNSGDIDWVNGQVAEAYEYTDELIKLVGQRIAKVEKQSQRMKSAIDKIMCQRPHQPGWNPFGYANVCHEHCLRCIGEFLIATWEDEK